MNRMLVWGLVGAFLGGGLAVLIAMYDEAEGQMAVAGDLPLTEDQVRGHLLSRGWADIRLSHDARYIEATGRTGERPSHMTVDSLTGKIIGDDSDDD